MFVGVLKIIKRGAFLKLTKLGLFLMLLGIIFQRRVVDTVKDLPPSDSRLNRGQTRFSSPCLLDLFSSPCLRDARAGSQYHSG